MQFPGQAPVAGVVYLTTMSRPDSALALAILYGLQGKREARLGAISVSQAGVQTAAFCDAVGRFYAGPGPLANSNRVLPIGLAAEAALPADPPMIQAVMDRRDEKDKPLFVHTTDRVSDTSEPCALIRNALTTQADGYAVIVLSAPATHLARVLDLQGGRELIRSKVKMLIVCGDAAPREFASAWPTPIVYCGKEASEAVLYPAASIERDFAWSPAHPVAEAYRAYRPMPYDSPTLDMAAMLYAIRPESGLFRLSESRSLTIDPEHKEEVLKQYTELASAKPVPRPAGRGGAANKDVKNKDSANKDVTNKEKDPAKAETKKPAVTKPNQ